MLAKPLFFRKVSTPKMLLCTIIVNLKFNLLAPKRGFCKKNAAESTKYYQKPLFYWEVSTPTIHLCSITVNLKLNSKRGFWQKTLQKAKKYYRKRLFFRNFRLQQYICFFPIISGVQTSTLRRRGN